MAHGTVNSENPVADLLGHSQTAAHSAGLRSGPLGPAVCCPVFPLVSSRLPYETG